MKDQTVGMDFKTATLGRTGLRVGRLGLAGSYGAPARAYEMAFDHGCNYFYSGSGRKRSQMKQAVRNLVSAGHRDKMVISIQTYARWGLFTRSLFTAALKSMALDHADILMLGWHNSPPSPRLMDLALGLKAEGLIRFIGISGHNRTLFARMAAGEEMDLFHIRYNPAHQGAARECFPVFQRPDAPGLVTYTATRWGHLLRQKYMPQGEAPLTAPDCYRFSLSDPRVNICLTGPRSEEEMAQALTALEKGPLSHGERERVSRIGAHVHDHAGGFFS